MTFSISKEKIIPALLVATSLFLINTVAEEASAGLFLEPAVTYEAGETSVNYPTPIINSSGRSDGFGLGLRLGFHLYETFFLGVDGRYSMPQFKDSSVNYDARAVSTNWSAVIGIQMPIVGLRVWGSYIFDGELNPENSNSFDVKFQNAKGYRIGAGFRLAAVSLNLEYQQLKYDQTSFEQIGPFSSSSVTDDVQLENKALVASVSFPLEF